ncbi:hypothetical protein, partial [Pontibacter rugosus]
MDYSGIVPNLRTSFGDPLVGEAILPFSASLMPPSPSNSAANKSAALSPDIYRALFEQSADGLLLYN